MPLLLAAPVGTVISAVSCRCPRFAGGPARRDGTGQRCRSGDAGCMRISSARTSATGMATRLQPGLQPSGTLIPETMQRLAANRVSSIRVTSEARPSPPCNPSETAIKAIEQIERTMIERATHLLSDHRTSSRQQVPLLKMHRCTWPLAFLEVENPLLPGSTSRCSELTALRIKGTYTQIF